MRNAKWVALTDAERGQIVSMWLLAADDNGSIPFSAELIQKICYMDNPPDLNKFIELEFLCDANNENLPCKVIDENTPF